MFTKKRRNAIKGILLISVFLSQSFGDLHAQRTSLVKGQSDAITWQLNATVSGVAFYHTVADCNGKKIVLLKLHNTNLYQVDASWDSFFTQISPRSGSRADLSKKIILQPGEFVANSCENNMHKDLRVDPAEADPTHAVDAVSFAFKHISVSRSSIN